MARVSSITHHKACRFCFIRVGASRHVTSHHFSVASNFVLAMWYLTPSFSTFPDVRLITCHALWALDIYSFSTTSGWSLTSLPLYKRSFAYHGLTTAVAHPAMRQPPQGRWRFSSSETSKGLSSQESGRGHWSHPFWILPQEGLQPLSVHGEAGYGQYRWYTHAMVP